MDTGSWVGRNESDKFWRQVVGDSDSLTSWKKKDEIGAHGRRKKTRKKSAGSVKWGPATGRIDFTRAGRVKTRKSREARQPGPKGSWGTSQLFYVSVLWRPIVRPASSAFHLLSRSGSDWRSGSKSLDTYLAAVCSSLLIRKTSYSLAGPAALPSTIKGLHVACSDSL